MNRIENLKQETKIVNELFIAINADVESLKLCIKKLYNSQTNAEKTGFTTSELNGKGFNKFDAPMFTLLALSIEEGLELSDKQILNARKRIVKYLPQLARTKL